ncbi:BFP_1a_G0003720.mRNA.1.CDS.1 [Saccharomyces cerevisiae]|nr:BFP_1a_G0003720.mRNA.1.CDS.1 [Saccharomyces cerevisiae]CAI7047412.1 BFP_1a_G0003720.mRNA.1.CDS.1 [Saccharomyces cerevisiae]
MNDSKSIDDVDELIWTIGRKSHLGMGSENVGIKLNSHDQIIADEYQNTNVPNIYSLGDVYSKENIKVYNSKITAMYYAMLSEKSPTRYKIVFVGSNEKVVGLHIIGDSSAEILQGFGVAIKMGATKADFDNCVAIHPTSAEELVTMR